MHGHTIFDEIVPINIKIFVVLVPSISFYGMRMVKRKKRLDMVSISKRFFVINQVSHCAIVCDLML